MRKSSPTFCPEISNLGKVYCDKAEHEAQHTQEANCARGVFCLVVKIFTQAKHGRAKRRKSKQNISLCLGGIHRERRTRLFLTRREQAPRRRKTGGLVTLALHLATRSSISASPLPIVPVAPILWAFKVVLSILGDCLRRVSQMRHGKPATLGGFPLPKALSVPVSFRQNYAIAEEECPHPLGPTCLL